MVDWVQLQLFLKGSQGIKKFYLLYGLISIQIIYNRRILVIANIENK